MITKNYFLSFLYVAVTYTAAYSQNVGINTTGSAPAATNFLEVLNPSTTANSVGIYSLHSGAISGTGYGIWAQKTGASTTNVAGYFSASGATNNYAIIVPSGGGSVGVGTTAPESLLELQGSEGNDAALTLDADDGDDNADTWFIKSLASDNTLSFTNHTNEYFRMNGPRLYVMNSGNSVFVGEDAGRNDDLSANLNVAIGYEAMKAVNTGSQNVAIGYRALLNETTGSTSVAVGANALQNQIGGAGNTGIGNEALTSCTNCNSNTSVGIWSLYSVISGSDNTAIGYRALYYATGQANIAIGTGAAINLTTGSNNIFIGYSIEPQDPTASNQLNIGNIIFGNGIDGTGTTLSSGNIGIGVTAPSEKLEVNGKTKTTTLQVTTGAADGSVLQSDASGNATWAPVGMPTAALTPYAGASAPSGWLICDGSAVNRTTYAALFAIVGTTYGAGDGSTTFNLPDLQGRVPVGVGTGTYKSAGIFHSNGASLTARTLGEYDGAEYPSGFPVSNHGVDSDDPAGGYLTTTAAPTTYSASSPVDYYAGNGEGGNMQPYIGLNYIIKY